MNAKKFLDKKADETMSQLNNREFKDELLSGYEKKKKTKVAWKILTAASCLVVVALAVTLLAVFIPSADVTEEQIPSYSQGDETVQNVSLQDVEKAIGGIDFLKSEADYCVRKYDKKSGDTLAYVVALTDYGDSFYNSITFFLSANKYYDVDRPHLYDKIYYGINFSMKYFESVTHDVDIYYYTCAGIIELEGKKIYIEFEGANMEQESLFVECLNSDLAISAQ